jgi:hypothetical protein
MVVAGVMGYPAKNRHPALRAPQAIASLPSNNEKGMLEPPGMRCCLSHVLKPCNILNVVEEVKERNDAKKGVTPIFPMIDLNLENHSS